MHYYQGTDDSYHEGKGWRATPEELASIIRDDIVAGRWNSYYGGKIDSVDAYCKFHRPGFITHNRLYIYGTEEEFKVLEKLIKPLMLEFTPRVFTGGLL